MQLATIHIAEQGVSELRQTLRHWCHELCETGEDESLEVSEREMAGLQSVIIMELIEAIGGGCREITEYDLRDLVQSHRTKPIEKAQFVAAWQAVANKVNLWVPPSVQAC